MSDQLRFPERIREIIGERRFKVDEIGKSGSQVICFDDMVLKIEKQSEESDTEHTMMDWLSGRLPVPRILYREQAGGINYLLMSRMRGVMACSGVYLETPERLARLLADGLHMLWNMDATGCPYDNSLENKLRLAKYRVENGLCDLEYVEPETYREDGFASPAELLCWLAEHQPEEQPAFSHGDFCLPNIFLQGGKVSGFIDLGRSGIADPYQDIALCYRSFYSNLRGAYGGRRYEGADASVLFDALGLDPDWEKIRYYILLDELF